MKLKNPSDRKVCFKIKTTAPKRYVCTTFSQKASMSSYFYVHDRYCVKPNSGVVDPNTEVSIAGLNMIIPIIAITDNYSEFTTI